MCGRTSLAVPQSVLEERFDAAAIEPLVPRYNVAPGDDLAVVRNDRPGDIDLVAWGLVPAWADDPDQFGFVNARAETAAEKPSFRDAVAHRRCLVLADGFYEWDDGRPYRFERADGAPFALAGLWERWEGAGRELTTATVLTTGAGPLVAPVHDREPVVLDRGGERRWLRDPPGDIPALGTDLTASFRRFPVSRAVNDPANDSPEVATPVEGSDDRGGEQAALDEFSG